MDGNSPLFDLSQLSFDEFVSFFFDHNVETEGFWYQDPDLISSMDARGVSPRVIVRHMTRLFTDAAEVTSGFSSTQINSAVWAMFSGGGFRLQKYLWLSSTPLAERLDCIHSMYFVYSEYVAKSTVEAMENCFSMWWDFVTSSFWEHLHFTDKIAEGDVLSLNDEHMALLGAMFQTLSRILALSDSRARESALHGLGHLHHPEVRNLVQGFLDKHRDEFPPEGILWVEQCRDGTVM